MMNTEMRNKVFSEEQALKKVRKICSIQEKCKADILLKLKSFSISLDSCQKIISILEKQNFINEQRFAIAFSRDKFRFNKWGKIKIMYALAKKNIQEDHIQTALNEINEDEYDLLIKSEVQKKMRTLKTMGSDDAKKKLIQFLSGRGFENGKIFDIISQELKNSENKFSNDRFYSKE